MVKKFSGREKLKLCVVMCLVFVFSFLLTVNAFAEYSVENDRYYGTYKSNRSEVGFVNVNHVYVQFKAYLHVFYPSDGVNPGHSSLISGISEEGSLAFNKYGFKIPTYTVVDNNGNYVGPGDTDLLVSGTTKVETGLFGNIKSITLTPTYLTIVKYILTK